MRTSAFVIAGLFAAEAAIACVCIPFDDPEMRQEAAQRIAAEASAVAEVERIGDEASGAMLFRVHKVHSGSVPAQFRLSSNIERTADGDVVLMTSCDVVPPPDERTLVVLYPGSDSSSYRIGGTCDHLFVNSPGAVDLIRAEARNLPRAAERG